MNIQTRVPNPFISIIMQEAGRDPQRAAFWERLQPAFRDRLRAAWNAMPAKRKRELYGPPRRIDGDTFAEQIVRARRRYDVEVQAQRATKRAAVKKEISRAIAEGIGNYRPSEAVRAMPDIPLLVQQELLASINIGKECCQDDSSADPPKPPVRYSVKAKNVRCRMKDESSAHDEVYLVTTAVDGNGAAVTRQSGLLSMNAGEDDSASPNHYIYPPAQPGGFLDIAIELWEDDGGYEEIGKLIAQLGQAAGTIPEARAVGAGAALQIIGGLVQLAASIDVDGFYGVGTRIWGTETALLTGSGTSTFRYYNPDTGWFDTRSWLYFVDYELRAHTE